MKKFLSVKEMAKILGISRMQVIRKIKKGKIKAFRVGRSWVIEARGLGPIFEKITNFEKKQVEKAVKKVIREYGETLRLLAEND